MSHRDSARPFPRLECAIVFGTLLLVSCRPAPSTTAPAVSPTATLSFPAELQTTDPKVNSFVQEAMTACAAGDYSRFTALWTSQQPPITLREFDRGWRAVRLLKVDQLQPFRTEMEGPVSYYLRATAGFDPSVRKPERSVELVMHQEDGQWRLARAPGELGQRLADAGLLAGHASTVVPPSADGSKP